MNLRCFRIDSKRRLDMYECKRNGAPENIAGASFAQNSFLATPCVVAINRIKPRNLKNSSHVRGSERDAFVAGITLLYNIYLPYCLIPYKQRNSAVVPAPRRKGYTVPTHPKTTSHWSDPDNTKSILCVCLTT